MKIIFLGTPEFAVASLEALLKTPWIQVLAICTQTDKEAGRGKKIQEPPVKKLALQNGLTVLQCQRISKEPEIIQKIKDLKLDILITCAFGQILSEEILNIAPAINVHASLLPKYRGAAPINWAILNGEKETGISIMKTEISLDAGPIILQEKCNIDKNETSIDLTKKLSVLGASALIKALELIKNKKASFTPQDNSKVTKAPMLKKEFGLIDWNQTTEKIHNQIRGLQPWPSAFTHFNGKMIKIWDSRVVARRSTCVERASPLAGNVSTEGLKNVPPGIITEIADSLKVKTGDGYINIYKLQPENKNVLNAMDWANGVRLKRGDKFDL